MIDWSLIILHANYVSQYSSMLTHHVHRTLERTNESSSVILGECENQIIWFAPRNRWIRNKWSMVRLISPRTIKFHVFRSALLDSRTVLLNSKTLYMTDTAPCFCYFDVLVSDWRVCWSRRVSCARVWIESISNRTINQSHALFVAHGLSWCWSLHHRSHVIMSWFRSGHKLLNWWCAHFSAGGDFV